MARRRAPAGGCVAGTRAPLSGASSTRRAGLGRMTLVALPPRLRGLRLRSREGPLRRTRPPPPGSRRDARQLGGGLARAAPRRPSADPQRDRLRRSRRSQREKAVRLGRRRRWPVCPTVAESGSPRERASRSATEPPQTRPSRSERSARRPPAASRRRSGHGARPPRGAPAPGDARASQPQRRRRATSPNQTMRPPTTRVSP